MKRCSEKLELKGPANGSGKGFVPAERGWGHLELKHRTPKGETDIPKAQGNSNDQNPWERVLCRFVPPGAGSRFPSSLGKAPTAPTFDVGVVAQLCRRSPGSAATTQPNS